MSKIVRLDLKDGLLLGSGFIARAGYTCIIYVRVPDSWLSGLELLPSKKEVVLEKLYGQTWREGNEDGSRYIVLDSRETLLDAHSIAGRVWLAHDPADRNYQYWYYHVTDDGELENRKQTDFNQV